MSGGNGKMNGKDLGPSAVSAAQMLGLDEADRAAAEELAPAPIIEIMVHSSLWVPGHVDAPIHHLKIWSDGTLEGFEKLCRGNKLMVINRAPQLMQQVLQPFADTVELLQTVINATHGTAETGKPGEPG